jgi:hypothetical protein
MHAALVWLALFAIPFWELKAPSAWNDSELQSFLADSPWAQTAGPAPGAIVYLASAAPVRLAEAEAWQRLRRRKPDMPEESDPDYAAFLREDGGKHIVLAVSYHNQRVEAFSDNAEYRRMEHESVLKLGRKTYHIDGHFPPTRADACLRLVFPRAVQPQDKALVFDVYLPGIAGNFKSAEFRVKELQFRGRVEY